ncbi:MAG: dockerin type I domain-containing protein [Candidatus Zixiibacteriota bacterium]
MKDIWRLTVSCFVAVIIMVAAGTATEPFISVDHVDGLNACGQIDPGAVVKFHIRITSDEFVHMAINNGYKLCGNEVNWTTLSGEMNPIYPWDLDPLVSFPPFFDYGMFIVVFGDGQGCDTIGFAGVAGQLGTGLPAGFDDIAYTITAGPFSGTPGAQVVLDSSFFPPAGTWLWDITPNVGWGGPYTYRFGECPGPQLYTFLEQDPIILKDLADRVLRVYVAGEDVAGIDLSSVVVQGKIPPYTVARIEGDLLVTDVFMFRFLSTWRPISSDVQGAYSISYNVNGETKTLFGDMNLQIYPADLNFDGVEDVNDITFLVDYMFRGGNAPMLEEALDVNRDGYVDARDLRELVQFIY